MHSESQTPASPVDAARQAIWRLFEEGYLDENMATAGLLAVDLGTRRGAAGWRASGPHTERTSTPRRQRAA